MSMRRFRFSLRGLFVVVTLGAFALGSLVWHTARERRIARRYDEVAAAMKKGFDSMPADPGYPWLGQTQATFNNAEYEFWQHVMNLTKTLEGWTANQWCFYFSEPGGEQSSSALVLDSVFRRFRDSFEPLKLQESKITTKQLGHGIQYQVQMLDSDTPVYATITIVEGPNGWMFVEGIVTRR